jgi:hypothetical protein
LEGLLILLAVAYFLVLPILTIVAWVRSSAHADQIAQLRRTLQELESRLAARQDEVRPTQAAAARQAGTETASESPSDIAPGPEAASAGEPVRPELTVASAITEPAMPVAEELADIELLPAGSRDIAEAATTPAMPESIDVPLGVAARIDASEATSAEIAAAPCPTLAANAKETPAGRRERRQRTGPSLPERIFTAARNWLMGGNTIAFMQKNLPGGSASSGDSGGGCNAGGTAPPESGLWLIALLVLGIGARRRVR